MKLNEINHTEKLNSILNQDRKGLEEFILNLNRPILTNEKFDELDRFIKGLSFNDLKEMIIYDYVMGVQALYKKYGEAGEIDNPAKERLSIQQKIYEKYNVPIKDMAVSNSHPLIAGKSESQKVWQVLNCFPSDIIKMTEKEDIEIKDLWSFCKKDNKYVIEYCSDSRIIAREYNLV